MGVSSISGGQQQISVSAAIGTAHASAKLVELREAHAVGAVDDDGVAEGDVESVLDDGGGNQDIGFVMHEFEHHFFQFAFAHLPVAYGDAGARHERLQLGGNLPDRVYAVVHEINLAAAIKFLLDGGLDQLFIPVGDYGLDRHAIFGRRFDDAHVAQADERHVQRARDGRGRHGEHVDLGAHLLDALFVADAEALLFVDDEQTEVGELYVFREQAMRADQDIDFADRDVLREFL